MKPKQFDGVLIPKGSSGLWTMSPGQYINDPCETPSLSSGIICTMIESSALHAWHAHPRLGGGKNASNTGQHRGSAVHKLALGKGADIVYIDAKDFRTKAAQEARDGAEADGKIPVLSGDAEPLEALGKAMREAAEEWLGCSMAEALTEVVVVWDENGHQRRIMVDAMRPDLMRMCDLKSTTGSAAFDECVKRIFQMKYQIQEAHYLRGVDAIDPANTGRREFAFIFGEQEAPHAVSAPIQLSEGAHTLGEQMRQVGTRIWDVCCDENKWPGYSQEPAVAEPPPWEMSRWTERMMSDSSLNAGDSQ